jgi:predicted lipid-binding transport protein (Tim44 family)
MRYVVALFFPWASFFTIGRPIAGVICLVLQITVIGWLPATIWAFAAIGGHNADKRTDRIVNAVREKAVSSLQPAPAVTADINSIEPGDLLFDPIDFLVGAKLAHGDVVTAYHKGDRLALKNLLSREVYDGFNEAIKDRDGRGETSEARIVSTNKAEILTSELRGHIRTVTVCFVSQLVLVTRNASGAIISGSMDRAEDVTDVWTFARNLSSRNPNWLLVATRPRNT